MSNNSIVIEDAEDSEDEPGPIRSKHKPNTCLNESKWFKETFLQPKEQVKEGSIPEEYIEKFQDLIWSKPHDRMVPGYGMLPSELARVSAEGKRGWLVTSHFDWICRCLNQQQKHTRCFVLDPAIRKEAISKLFNLTSRKDVERLIFVQSVGRQDDGVVFFGTGNVQGDHWSVAVFDVISKNLTYCDTLGWPAPSDYITSILNYTRFIGFSKAHQLELVMAHEPGKELHECTIKCTNYPLQTCSDVCGVIAMVIIAVATLDRDLFNLLLTPLKYRLNIYLTNPTDYSSYLRHVIICWLAQSYIDIKRISMREDFDPFVSSNDTDEKLVSLSGSRSYNGDEIHSDENARSNNSVSEHSTPKMVGIKRKLPDFRNDIGSVKKSFKSSNISVNQYLRENFDRSHYLHKDNEEEMIEFVTEVTLIFPEGKTTQEKMQKKKEFFRHFTFNNSFERDRDDSMSTKSYIKDLAKFPDNPILIFKGIGRSSPILSEEDVAIGIQTKFQRESLKLYCKKCVCVEQCKKNGFFITTVSVFYEGIHELPCAWLVSNRNDEGLNKFFFDALKAKSGDLKTEILLGDTSSSLHRAWSKVFSKPGRTMFNTWEMMHLLSRGLPNYIHDTKSLEEVKEIINILPHITDFDLFKAYSACVLKVVKRYSPEAHEYVRAKYIEDPKDTRWAPCHRLEKGEALIPFLQPFSNILDLVDFSDENCGARTDLFLHKLLQLIKYYETKLEIEESEEKIKRACSEAFSKHKQSMPCCDIYHSASGEEWQIRASRESSSCNIIESGLDESDCPIKCEQCKICVHHYICTCPQYLLVPGGCNHIHFVHLYKKMNSVISNEELAASPNDSDGQKKADVEHLKTKLVNFVKNCDDAHILSTIYNGLQ